MNISFHRIILLMVVLLSACSQTASATPTPAQVPEPPPSPSLMATLPDGGFVYGDPEGRFSLPLVGDWTPVESDGSYGHFRLAEPELEMYVVTVESEDLDAVAEAALTQIGVDASALSQLATAPMERWTIYAYALDSDQGITLGARQLGGAAVAFILSGELSVTTSPPAEALLALDGFTPMPLAEYLEFQPPRAPTTIEAIEDLKQVEFYNGRTKLVGRLIPPEGGGRFPAVVLVHGSGPCTREEYDFLIPTLQTARFAVFSYDKRGAGDSEGVFHGTEDLSGNPAPSEWRLPQLATDALAAVAFLENLREINPERIGLLGGSQAGWIIPQVIARSDVPAFVVIVNGPTVSVGEVNYHQQLTGKPRHMPPMTESEREELSEQLAAFDGMLGFDPRQSIEAMSIPGLWILGDRDGWIPARESRLFLESMIAGHDKDFTIQYYPDGGHEWQSAYVSEAVDWILAHLEQ
jgi:dienelactone hydrolase